MSTTTTSYELRRPRGLDRSERSLARVIQQREQAYQTAGWAMLALGIAGLIAGPLVLATAIFFTAAKLHQGWHVSWWSCFAGASLIIIPLLFWLELATRTRWMSDELSGGASMTDALLMREREGAAAALVWGPRMVLEARQRWKRPVATATLHDAAAVVSFLRHFENGVAADELPTVQPLRVLCYLVSRDWVAVSRNGDRVWLLSESRKFIDSMSR